MKPTRRRIAVVYTINADNEQDAFDKGDQIVSGADECDAEYEGVWTVRPDPTEPLGELES